MKVSRYSIFTEISGRFYIYHQLTKSLIEVDKDLFSTLRKGEMNAIDPTMRDELSNMGFLLNEDINEEAVVMTANIRERFQSKALRVTILPTLSCNFSCWYCYEKHPSTLMRQDSVPPLIDFITRQASERKKDLILLDWFGGEPLLCFDKIISPVTLELSDWCKSNGVVLHSMITTNGSLIDKDRAIQMEQIGLRQFQITLDGGKESHNQTRFSRKIPDSYERILENIHLLCSHISDVSIELRINYTPKNIASLEEILEEFDKTIRKHITISPHIVWQKVQYIEELSNPINTFLRHARNKGYKVLDFALNPRCVSCYTENSDQYVINHNLDVYKCTARDFDGKFCIGKISKDGSFIPNGLYYDYIVAKSPFVNDRCLKCEILPTCLCSSSCIQKLLEGEQPKCYKELHKKGLYSYIKHQVNL